MLLQWMLNRQLVPSLSFAKTFTSLATRKRGICGGSLKKDSILSPLKRTTIKRLRICKWMECSSSWWRREFLELFGWESCVASFLYEQFLRLLVVHCWPQNDVKASFRRWMHLSIYHLSLHYQSLMAHPAFKHHLGCSRYHSDVSRPVDATDRLGICTSEYGLHVYSPFSRMVERIAQFDRIWRLCCNTGLAIGSLESAIWE